LLCDLGPRRTEIAELDVEHVNLEAGTVEVPEKGEQSRVPLTVRDETRATLLTWLPVQPPVAWPLP